MSVKYLTVICMATTISMFAATSRADAQQADHRWMPKPPQDRYWQAPDWPALNQPPAQRAPTANSAYQRPQMPPQGYRPPPRMSGPAGGHMQRPGPMHPPGSMRAPGNQSAPYARNPARGVPPTASGNQMRPMPPPPRGPYGPSGYGAGPDNGASAYNTPGYRPYRRSSNNSRFWGRSGPSKWMNPNKRNMENGWDDMINAPSRMGNMPGGWSAPEVSMPNPVDMADQVQDNVKDLPDQVKDMDVGNN